MSSFFAWIVGVEPNRSVPVVALAHYRIFQGVGELFVVTMMWVPPVGVIKGGAVACKDDCLCLCGGFRVFVVVFVHRPPYPLAPHEGFGRVVGIGVHLRLWGVFFFAPYGKKGADNY